MFTVEFTAVSISGIRQGHFCGHQAQQLGGVRGLQGGWWNAKLGGIEGHRWKKAATIAVYVVRLLGIGIEIIV
jgi:hypothetical protein